MTSKQKLGQYWTPIINNFNPWDQLWGDDLDIYFVEREDSPLEKLVLEMQADRVALQTILTGHRGSGKSSELAKFAQIVQANYFVIWLDLSAGNIIDNLNQLDILSMMGFAAYKVAENELTNKPDKLLLDNLVESLSTLIREEIEKDDFYINVSQILGSLVCFGAGVIGGTTAAAAIGGLMGGITSGAPFTLGATSKVLRKLEMGPRLVEVIEQVRAIIYDIEDKANKPVLLIVDGLDRVIELDQARSIFANSWVLRTPPCRAIYTAPVVLCYSPDYSQVRDRFPTIEFPNVKLHEQGRSDTPYDKGWQTMRDVVNKRVLALGLTMEEVISPEALDLLVGMSGGVMRQIITLMRDSILEAEIQTQYQIDVLAARKAIYNLQRGYARPLGRTERQELKDFLVTGERSGTGVGDNLIFNGYILNYVNHNVWYDINPIVYPLL